MFWLLMAKDVTVSNSIQLYAIKTHVYLFNYLFSYCNFSHIYIYYVYGMRITVLRIYESTAFGLETCSVH